MRVLVAGDFVPQHRIACQIESEDYSCLDEVTPFVQSVDYSIVNFESPVVSRRNSKPIEKTGPNLSCTKNAMICVAHAGFNCVTLANNHFRDYGQDGVEDTIRACVENKIDYVGGGVNRHEAERVLCVTKKDQTLAIINVCENEWSIARNNDGGSNPLDIISVCHFIKEAKQKKQFVLVIVHGGIEHYNLPTPRMKKTYRFFIENGADAVVNHHQHCYSGYEVYLGKPIFYGLGNFCFDKRITKDKKWIEGYFVTLDFEKEIEFQLFPYIQCDELTPSVQMVNDALEFEKTVLHLNKTIADDFQLQSSFKSLYGKGILMANQILKPYSSKLAIKLQRFGLLPSFVNKQRQRKLLAYIQCESHEEVVALGLRHVCG